MTNDNNEDNRIELIGLNEFIQDDIELGDADFERPFPDSDEAIRALQDIAEGVEELEAECYRLRAELKTALAERDAARREVCEYGTLTPSAMYALASARGWDCFKSYKKEETL
jgi:hypothetical protein